MTSRLTCVKTLGLPAAWGLDWSARTGSVRVAVKRRVCREAWSGSWSMMKESSGAKVGVRRRSASSRTCCRAGGESAPQKRARGESKEAHKELDALEAPLALVALDEVDEPAWGGNEDVGPLA